MSKKFKTEQELEYYYKAQLSHKISQLMFFYKKLSDKKTDNDWILKEYKPKLKKRIEKAEKKYIKDLEKAKKNFQRVKEGKKEYKYKKKDKEITKSSLLKTIQKYCRLRDSNKNWMGVCISCWKVVHYKKADGGHYISRVHNYTAFNPDNIHLQCKWCNIKMSLSTDESKRIVENYRKNLIKKIWLEKVEELEESKHKVADFFCSSRKKEKKQEYLEKCKSLKAEKT